MSMSEDQFRHVSEELSDIRQRLLQVEAAIFSVPAVAGPLAQDAPQSLQDLDRVVQELDFLAGCLTAASRDRAQPGALTDFVQTARLRSMADRFPIA